MFIRITKKKESYSPEPLDDYMIRIVIALIVGMFFPVTDVNSSNATH